MLLSRYSFGLFDLGDIFNGVNICKTRKAFGYFYSLGCQMHAQSQILFRSLLSRLQVLPF